MSQIKKIAVIGTGVIGAGWIIRCLAHNKIVHAFDKDIKLKKNLITEIKRTWPYVKKLFNKKNLNLKNFKYFVQASPSPKDSTCVVASSVSIQRTSNLPDKTYQLSFLSLWKCIENLAPVLKDRNLLQYSSFVTHISSEPQPFLTKPSSRMLCYLI